MLLVIKRGLDNKFLIKLVVFADGREYAKVASYKLEKQGLEEGVVG